MLAGTYVFRYATTGAALVRRQRRDPPAPSAGTLNPEPRKTLEILETVGTTARRSSVGTGPIVRMWDSVAACSRVKYRGRFGRPRPRGRVRRATGRAVDVLPVDMVALNEPSGPAADPGVEGRMDLRAAISLVVGGAATCVVLCRIRRWARPAAARGTSPRMALRSNRWFVEGRWLRCPGEAEFPSSDP